jgi:hypothetical protein
MYSVLGFLGSSIGWLVFVSDVQLLIESRKIAIKIIVGLVITYFSLFPVYVVFLPNLSGWPFTLGLGAFVNFALCGILSLYFVSKFGGDLTRDEFARRLPKATPIDINLSEFNIEKLEIGSMVSLHREENKPVLDIPQGTICTNILRHNDQLIAKLACPSQRGYRICLLGKDVTGQPFLLEVPPEYKDKSIVECERWLVQANEEDEIISS